MAFVGVFHPQRHAHGGPGPLGARIRAGGGRLAGMTDMPSEDPRDSDEPVDDPKHQETDPDQSSDVDDPDAPAPFSGPYS